MRTGESVGTRAAWPAPSRVTAEAVAGAVLALAWLVPLRYLPWPGFYSEAVAGVSGVLFLVAAAVRHPAPAMVPQSVALACLALVALPFIQVARLSGSYQADALLAGSYLLAWATAIWTGRAQNGGRGGDVIADTLAWTFVAGGIALVGTAWTQWLGPPGRSEWLADGPAFSRPGSNLGQANHFATLCLFGLLAAGYLHATGRIGTATLALVALWLTLGMALAQSRTTWVAAFVLLAWALARRRSFGAALGLGPAVAAFAVAVYAAMFAVALWLPEALGLVDAVDQGRFEAGTRPTLWAQMLAAIRESPWVGYGWLQGHTAQMAGALEHPGREFSGYSHNLVLDLMVWNGVPIGLAIAGLLGLWYVRTGLRVEGPADAFRFAVVTVLGVHSMLEYPFAYLYFIVPVGLLAGQLCRPGGPGAGPLFRRTKPAAATGVTSATAVTGAEPARVGVPVAAGALPAPARAAWAGTALYFALVTALTAGGIAIARDYLLAEHDRREVQMVLARIGGQRPFPPQPDLWVLDQLEASARNARREIRAGMPADELEDLARITRRYPTAFFLRTSAAAWALNGDEARAQLELRRLRAIHGEPAWQASLRWLEETSTERGWPLGPFVAQARAQPLN
jgi:O-antigen ligase